MATDDKPDGLPCPDPVRLRRRRLLIGGAAALWLAGCGVPTGPERVRVAAVTVPRTPWHDMWVRFAENANGMPDALTRVELYILSQFGPEEAMIANLRRNRAQMSGLSLQGAAQLVPELNLLLAPYLFDSQEEVDFVLDNFLLEPFSRLLEARGVTIVQWADVGWTHLYSRAPLIDPADARGLRLRTSRAAGARAFGRALEANQMVLPFTDVIPSLQTGLIDGGQSGIGMYALAGVAREAPHLTLTAHAYDAGLIAANADWWHGLPDATRAQLRQALDPVEQTRIDVRRMIGALEQGLHDNPAVQVHALDPGQRDAWRAATQPVTDSLVRQIGGQAEAIHETIVAGKQAFARTRNG